MKSPSLDKLYTQLNKHILLVQAYTEIPELFFIVKACRLKPHDYIFGNKSNKVILYRWWFDEFGNSFNIKDKKIEILYNDLSLEREKIVCTDLYYGLSLDRIVKMSKMLYLCAGRDEDLNKECFFLTLLGIDNYLRSYIYLYGKWQQVSPLLTGLKNLQKIAQHTNIQYFTNISNQKNWPVPCYAAQEWLSCTPVTKSFAKIIGEQHEMLLPILNNKEINE
jgi:hypothetical protein